MSAAIARIEQVVSESTIGRENEHALRAVQPALQALRSTLPWPIVERVRCLTYWMEILFSAHLHERFGGPERVRTLLLEDCAGLLAVLPPSNPQDTARGRRSGARSSKRER